MTFANSLDGTNYIINLEQCGQLFPWEIFLYVRVDEDIKRPKHNKNLQKIIKGKYIKINVSCH